MSLAPTHIAETILYVDDLETSVQFYHTLFECRVLRRDERFCALRIANEQVLLLFVRGGSVLPTPIGGDFIPPHDGSGPLHVCFGMREADVGAWENRLQAMHIGLESRVLWPGGAISLYFRDPDSHAVELATPGLWSAESLATFSEASHTPGS